MFERLDPAARRVLFFAKYNAAAMGEPHIEPEHLLAGLLLERDVTRQDIPQRRAADPLLSPRARKIVASAASVADEIGSATVDPRCLLLALLRDESR